MPQRRPEHALRKAFVAGRDAHPSLPLAECVFSARALDLTGHRLQLAGAPRDAGRLVAELARVASADLFLAIACDTLVPGAWEAFTASYLPRMRGLLRQAGANGALADEIASELPGELLAEPGASGARTRLGTYDGSGCLFVWLSVLALRRLSAARRAKKMASLEELGADGNATLEPADPDSGPAATAVATEAGARLAAGLRERWQVLTDRERIAVVCRYGHGVSQVEIARLLGVGPPRVSRILDAALVKLRSLRESVLGRTPQADPADLGRSWHALDDAIGRHLATSGVAAPPSGSASPDHGTKRAR